MANWKKKLDDMTTGKAAADPGALPIGYVVTREPKTNRRSFALQQSVLDALADIAKEKQTSINGLVNDILLDYVSNYKK